MYNQESIVKLKVDENDNIIGSSAESISLESVDYSTLEDGLYVSYRGSDWVFGNDASLVNTAVVTSGQTQTFSQSFTQSTQTKQTSTIGVTFDASYVKFAITQAYDITISDSVTKTITITQQSPIGKDRYYKIYLTYARYDVIRIKNGQATHSATTYEFMGGRSVVTEVPEGQISTINTDSLVIKEDKCLLQEVTDSVWQIIDTTPNLNIETTGRSEDEIFDLNKNMLAGNFSYTSPSCNILNLIFNITEAGTYVFLVGKVVNLDLATLNINSRDQITRLESKKCDNTNDTYIRRYLEGGNYVLQLSTNNDSAVKYNLFIQKQ